MKNSKEYAKKIEQLYRELKKKGPKSGKIHFDDPIEALIVAAISEFVKDKYTKNLLKNINAHFVDYNDLRVSRSEEILEAIDLRDKGAKPAVLALTKMLNSVFNKYDHLSLATLDGQGKRQGRKELEDLENLSKFVESFCFMTAMDGHAIPLTQKMLAFLRDEEYVDPDADESEIMGFLERKISAANGWEFYSLLRHHCESLKKKTKKMVKKTAEKKTTTKKTTKKKTTKKKKSSNRKGL